MGSALLVTLAYSLRSEFRLSVGDLGDAPYLSGFNNDEPGAPRYRWTGRARLPENEPAVGNVSLPLSLNPNAQNKILVDVKAAANAPSVQINVNGVAVGQAPSVANQVKTLEFSLPQSIPAWDKTQVEIRAATFKPEGDSRRLGVQVSQVRLLTAPTLRWPPLEAFLWSFLLAGGMSLAALRLASSQKIAGRFRWNFFAPVVSVGAGLFSLLVALVLPGLMPRFVNLWYTSFWLFWLAVAALLLAGLLWYKIVIENLTKFLAALESSKTLARNILLGILAVYLLYAFSIIVQMDYIGHADYADNAVAARNIVQGKGYSLDYAAQFYQKYTLPRPADTWPPLQPFLIVPFFALFGPQVWAAKLPNLILVVVLALVIFGYGSRLFNKRAGLFAALLTLITVVPAFSPAPAFFETIAYPINDLAFTLLAFLAIVTLYLAATGEAKFWPLKKPPVENQSETETAPKRESWWAKNRDLQPWLVAGLCNGLFFLSKPSGGLLIGLVGLWLLGRKYLGRDRLNISWKALLVTAAVAGIVIAPYLLRNMIDFGTPLASTERYDAWLTKWYPPDDRIYDLFTPFSEKPLPNPRQLLEYGWDAMFTAVNNQFRKFFEDVLKGELYAPLLLFLAAVGIVAAPRRRAELLALVAAIFVVYLLFFNVFWHYEPRYFLTWLPWLNLLAGVGLFWLYDKIRAPNPEATESPARSSAAIWSAILAVAILFAPNLQALAEHGDAYTSGTGIVTTANWLKANTPADAVIMSRNVWELSFHSERKSVMIPNNATLPEIKKVMREYGVRYLQLDHLEPDDRTINRQWGQRQALWKLLDRKPEEGFKLVYDKGGLLVYEWNGN